MQADISGLYAQHLGRAATPDEIQYLNRFVQEGHIHPGEIGSIIQSMPEYQQKMLEQNTDAYGQKLNAQNGAILDQTAAKINSNFASLGRPVSSAMGASLTQAGGQLAQRNQSLLADFYGRGLQQNQSYQQNYGNAALDRGYARDSEQRQRDYQIEDYYRQQNDFNNYQNAHSGWNAITPEFAVGATLNGLGKVGAAYAGGMAGR